MHRWQPSAGVICHTIILADFRVRIINCLLNFFQPVFTLFFRVYEHNIKHSSIEVFNSAQVEDTVLPDGFQRITDGFLFSFCIG
jgi:hypothetical protein